MSGDNARWQSKPYLAGLIRLVVFIAPILLAIGLMILVSRVFPRPQGFLPAASWWLAMSGFSTIVILILDRWFRRLLPVVALFKLSLIFPDQAPSRFKTALRAGTVRQLERQMEAGSLHSATPQASAEQLIALASKLNTHDRLTRGHTERVRAYSVMIGQEMGLSERELELLNWSGLVHDIGKLTVPTEILNKPGKPSDEEWKVLRDHPANADELIEPLRSWLGDWAESATQHHERFDGKGYPLGLAGRDITLAGRIVAVADAYDVMTSTRSYKKAMPTDEARQELVANAGTQFDPIVVRAFLGIAIGKLRLVAGPLSSLIQLPAGGSTLGSAAATGASAAATVAVSAIAGIITPQVAEEPPTPPALAMVVEANDLFVAGTEDADAIRIDVTESGFDADSTFEIVGETVGGEVLTRDDGAIVFIPQADFNGTVVLPYRVCDEDICDEATLTLEISAVNDAPEGVDDRARVDEDTVAVIDVLANDIDVDGESLTIVAAERVDDPEHTLVPASLAFDGRRIVVTPEPDDFGSVRVAYEATDAAGEIASAVLTLEVTAVNDRPIAQPDSASMIENDQLRVDVLANDEDVDGDQLFIERIDSISDGTASIVDGQVLFSPRADFTGEARFTYIAHDGGDGRSSAEVVIEVLRDPNRLSLAADRRALLEDSGGVSVDVLANDTSGAGLDADSVVITRGPGHGSVSVSGSAVSYVPDPNWFGVDTLDYTACDLAGECATETLTFAVVGVNDAPSYTPGADLSVSEDAGEIREAGWASSIVPGPFGEIDQTVTFEVVAADTTLFSEQPVVTPSGELQFTTAPDANGSTILVVELVDSGGTADGGVDRSQPTMSVLSVDARNDAPSFVSGPDIAVAEDSGPHTATGWATAITPGPADELGQTVAFDVQVSNTGLFSAQPTLSPAGDLRFTPAAGMTGSASITVTALDDGGTANGGTDSSTPRTFTIVVDPVNDPPVAADDSGVGFSTAEDTVFTTGDVTANDSDVDSLVDASSVAVVGSTSNGALTNNGDGTFDYLPDPDFFGSDTFTYTITDAGGEVSNQASVTIVVDPVNDPPVAADDSGVGFSTAEDTVFTTTDVTANDSDVDSLVDASSVVVVGSASNGALTNNRDGTFDYLPDPDFFGSDTFTYTITDAGAGVSNQASVTIVVDPVNDPPVAADDSGVGFTTMQNTLITTYDVTANDSDTDDAFNYTSLMVLASPVNGTLVHNGDGTFDFDPAPGWSGTDTFTYTIDDMSGDTSNVATVTLEVAFTNAAPVAVDDGGAGFTTTEDTPFTTPDVTSNDSDIDDGTIDPSTADIVTMPANGVLTNNGDGTFDYAPDPDFNGTDSFTYHVNDSGNLLSNTATVTLSISATNDRPVGVDDSGAGFSTTEDTTFTTPDVTTNDSDVDDGVDPASATVVAQPANGTATSNGDGTFDYQPDGDFNGTDAFTYQIQDPSGEVSAPATVTIVVVSVNDEPSFTPGVDVVVETGSSDQTFAGWATSIAAGPTDESTQTVTFVVTADDPSLFTVQPGINTAGQLKFTAGSTAGTATIDVILSDDGGTADGGDNETAPIQFTIDILQNDFDGVAYASDNCPAAFNVDQLDTDADGAGDACDATPSSASTGTFDSFVSFGSRKARAMAAGDINGDGDIDLVIANDGDADRVVSNPLYFFGQNLGSDKGYDVALGDLDGDGDIDAIFANKDDADTVWFNNGSGTFSDSGQSLGNGKSYAIDLGDFDGDGDLDLVVANDGEEDVVWFNDGLGTFTDSGQTFGTGKGRDVSVGDLDGDFDLDLVFANENEPDTVWFNDGVGNFTESAQQLGNVKSSAIVQLDIDTDGDTDLLIAADNDQSLLWLNDGSGGFTNSGQFIPQDHWVSLVSGDLDGDGDVDLVVGTHGNEDTFVFMNDGSGTFVDEGDRLGSTKAYALVVADFDGDGDLDVIVGDDGADVLWRNS